MDLKLKDVAELLNVSETTIRRWLKDGLIPGYLLNHQYRFSKSEIEDWILKCRLKTTDDPKETLEAKHIYLQDIEPLKGRGSFSFGLYRAMVKGGVFRDIPGETKEEIIQHAMKRLAPNLGFDPEVVAELLLDREALSPTALNNGVAVPHTRDSILEHPGSDFVVTVFPQHPLEYGSLDGNLVHTLFFLFSSTDKSHLQLLAKIAHFSSQKKNLDLLSSKPSQELLWSFMKDWESQLNEHLVGTASL